MLYQTIINKWTNQSIISCSSIYLFEISVDGREIFGVMAVDVSCGVTVQPVHDVLQLGVEAIDDRVKSHGVFVGEDDQLKVRVSHLVTML